MAREISNTDDVIDSREIIARIDELERDKEIAEDPDDPAPEHFTEDMAEELRKLKALAEGGEGYSGDWRYGATLIHDSYFEDYAQELAEDVGALQRDQSWPYNHIDWEAAADELRIDYTSVDFDGETYWVR